MANTRARLFVLLGALLAFLSYFLDFESPFFRSHITWLPIGIDLSTLSASLRATLSFLSRPTLSSVGLIGLISGCVFYLAYWGLLLLILVQTGFALWTLRSCSAHTRKWTRTLAIWGLILSACLFGGLFVFTAYFGGGTALQVSFWDGLRNALDRGILLVTFLLGGRSLALSTLGFVLILVFNHLTQPQASLPPPTRQGISRRAAILRLTGMAGMIFGLPSLAVGGYFLYRNLTAPDVSRYSGGYISNMAWAHDGQRIALISNLDTIVIWNALNGSTQLTFPITQLNNVYGYAVDLVWSSDGKQLITYHFSPLTYTNGHVSQDPHHKFQGLGIWETQTGKLLRRQPLALPTDIDPVHQLLDTGPWALNNQRLAVLRHVLTSNGQIRSTFLEIEEIASGTLVSSRPVLQEHPVVWLTWAPDNVTLAANAPTGSVSSVLTILNSSTGQTLHTYAFPVNNGVGMAPAWSPDGRRIALSNGNGTQILEVASGKTLAQYREMVVSQDDIFDLLAWSPNGQHLVLARNRGKGFGPISFRLALLTLADGRIVWQQEDDNHIQALAWSPDSQYLALLDIGSIVQVRHIP